MLNTIFEIVIRNWKTTCAGLATAIVWLLGALGVPVPKEVQDAFVAFLATLSIFFATDGRK